VLIRNKNVDLVVTCYERTWEKTLSRGHFSRIVEYNSFSFFRRIVLINNVVDKEKVRLIADNRKREGEIDDYIFVDEEICRALLTLNLTRNDFGRAFYLNNWALVAITLPGSQFLLHFDTENKILPPYTDWITPSLELMERNPKILVCSPFPIETATGKPSSIAPRNIVSESNDHIVLSPASFGDGSFLIRKQDFLSINYRERCIASIRYPLSHIEFSFEARIDSWMRHNHFYLGLAKNSWLLQPDNMGVGYPADLNFQEKTKKFLYGKILSVIKRIPWRYRFKCLNF